MRIELIEVLRQAVPFSSYVWALADPETEVPNAPLADVPVQVFDDLPRLIRARHLTTVNRWNTLDRVASSVQLATDGDPNRSLLYREILADLGVGDVATVHVPRRPRPLGVCRPVADEATTGPTPPPSSTGCAACAPTITAALRRCLARTFELPAAVPERLGPVVLVLSPDLHVKAQTPYTDEYLRALLPPDGDRRPIPAGAYNVGAQLLAIEAGVDDRPAVSRVRLRDGVWLTFRAARVEAEGDPAEQDIAVSIEPASPAERLDLFSRAHALTPREREVVQLLVEGADTKALADSLFLSAHTVQDHLKSIFAKTGARNRRTLLTRVTGR